MLVVVLPSLVSFIRLGSIVFALASISSVSLVSLSALVSPSLVVFRVPLSAFVSPFLVGSVLRLGTSLRILKIRSLIGNRY